VETTSAVGQGQHLNGSCHLQSVWDCKQTYTTQTQSLTPRELAVAQLRKYGFLGCVRDTYSRRFEAIVC
jgi:hypothetical protein